MKLTIVPTILTKNKKDFLSKLRKLSKEAKNIQIDIMDNKFVPNTSIRIKDIPDLKKYSNKFGNEFEAHLMVEKPERIIDDVLKKGFKAVIFHYEAVREKDKISKLIDKIRKARAKPGLAINPRTKVERVYPFLKNLDRVMVMAVQPGFGGRNFRKGSFDKINKLRKKAGKALNIEVDGGINEKTAPKAIKAGANILAAGSFVSRQKSVKQAAKMLKKSC